MDLLCPDGVTSANLPSGLDDLHLLPDSDLLDVELSPFTKFRTVEFPFDPGSKKPFGFAVSTDERYLRAFATKFTDSAAQDKHGGSYILRVGNHPIFSVDDFDAAVAKLADSKTPPTSVEILFAYDWKSHLADDRPPPLHMRACDIRHVAALCAVSGEGLTSAERLQIVRALSHAPSLGYTGPDPDDLELFTAAELLILRRLQNEHMTEEEKKLTSFTRKNLMRLANWSDWQKADDKQLDAHYNAGAIGKAVPRLLSFCRNRRGDDQRHRLFGI